MVLILSDFAIISDQPPNSPFSDVTSSLKPTSNGEICQVPYKLDNYTWDMYFCYKNHCPTATNSNSTCKPGQFAGIQLLDNKVHSFQLKTELNGINEQNLVYYYYISSDGLKSIRVRKEEQDGSSEILNIVTSSPFNGWIKQQVTFNVIRPSYKIYFDLQKTSGSTSLIDIALDEISIWGEDESTATHPTISDSTNFPTSVFTYSEQTTTTIVEPSQTSIYSEDTSTTILSTEESETSSTDSTSPHLAVEDSTAFTEDSETSSTSSVSTYPGVEESTAFTEDSETGSTVPTSTHPLVEESTAFTEVSKTSSKVSTSTYPAVEDSTAFTETSSADSTSTHPIGEDSTAFTEVSKTSAADSTSMRPTIEVSTAFTENSKTSPKVSTSMRPTAEASIASTENSKTSPKVSTSMRPTIEVSIAFTEDSKTSPKVSTIARTTIELTTESTTTIKDKPSDSNKKTLIIILATVLPIALIGLIGVIIYILKKSSLCVRQSSSDKRPIFELNNRVAPI